MINNRWAKGVGFVAPRWLDGENGERVGKLGSLLIECATSEQTLDGDPKHGDCTGDTQIRTTIRKLDIKKILLYIRFWKTFLTNISSYRKISTFRKANKIKSTKLRYPKYLFLKKISLIFF